MARTDVIATFSEEEVAAQLKFKSLRAFRDFLKTRPFYRLAGRSKVFTAADIAKLYEAMPCPSSSSADTGPTTGMSVVPSQASLLTKAHELLTEPLRRPSGRSGNGKSLRARSSVVVPLRRS
jgi:hypothetical protein